MPNMPTRVSRPSTQHIVPIRKPATARMSEPGTIPEPIDVFGGPAPTTPRIPPLGHPGTSLYTQPGGTRPPAAGQLSPRQQMYQAPGNQATFGGVMKPIGGMAPGSSLYHQGSPPPMQHPDGSNVGDGRYRENPFPGDPSYQSVIDAQAAHNAGLPRTSGGGLAPFTTNFNHPGYEDHVASEQAAQDARERFRLGSGQRPVGYGGAMAQAPQQTHWSQSPNGGVANENWNQQQHWSQLPNGGVAMAPQQSANMPVTSPQQPQRPMNGYNTPNFNTYVTPDGRFAEGFGPEHRIDSMVQANRQQEARRQMTGTQSAQVDNHAQIMANRAAAARQQLPSLAPGLIGADGQRVAPPSMDQYAGKSIGGTLVNESTQRASNMAARQRIADQQRIARRSSLMNGRPIQAKFQAPGQTGGPAPFRPSAPVQVPGGSTQMVPNPSFVQQNGLPADPFGMPGRIPHQQQHAPTSYWGALQSMLYGR